MSHIIFQQAEGLPIGIISLNAMESVPEAEARKVVPAGAPYLIVPYEAFPANHSLIDAWVADFSEPDGYGIGLDNWAEHQASRAGIVQTDFVMAKAVAHVARRAARAAAFKPHDEQIKLAIPGEDPALLDAPRQAIREVDAATQEQIDAAANVAELEAIVGALVNPG